MRGWMLAGLLMVTLLFSGCFGSSSPAFNDLPRNDLPESVDVRYSWVGYGPYSLREHYQLARMKDNKSYQVRGELSRISTVGGTGFKQMKTYEAQLPTEAIKSLLESINADHWTLANKPAEVIDHTDDYPNRIVELHLGPNETVRLVSTSNTSLGTPWNLYQGESLYTTEDSQAATTVDHVLSAIRPADYGTWE